MPSPSPVSPRAPGVVVGRDRDLGQLHDCLEQARAGRRQIVFVSGEPGIGKTTLAEAFLAELGLGEEVRLAEGRCIETHGAGEAYLPLLEAMTRLCRQRGRESMTRVLLRHAPTWLMQMPSVLAPADRRRLERQAAGATRPSMLRELADAVEAIADDVPLILWLEDLHWSDPSTIDWLTYLARRPGPARVVVLGTYRAAEALMRGHPLEAAKDALKVHGHCREIALEGLDERAVGEYLAHRFPALDNLPALAGTIQARTGGNPLFVVHVADDLVRRGILVQRGGRWSLADRPDLVRVAIPEDIRRMIEHELDAIGSHERRMLEAASVAGVEFSAAAVAAAGQLDLGQVEDGCAALGRHAAFLTALGAETWPDGTLAGRYRFRHALHQEVVYDHVPAARRAELHRRIGERLEAGLAGRGAAAAVELAMHFDRGRDVRRAIRYLQLAGDTATRRSAAHEAVAHLTRALELVRTLPPGLERAEEEVVLETMLGGPLMAIKGRGAPEVARCYARAQTLCEEIGDTPRLFPVLWGLFLFRRSRGEIDAAQGFARRLLLLAQGAGDPALLIQAHHALWATLFARGDLAAARDHADQALGLYDPDRHATLAAVYGNHDAAVCALGHGAWAAELGGEPEHASRQSEEAVILARRLGHPFSEAHALLYGARVHQFRGDWRATLERAETAAVIARERGFVQLEAWAAVTGGWAQAAAGAVEEGLTRMRQGLATLRGLDSGDFTTYFRGLLSETLARTGRPGPALEVVTEALAVVERTGERFYAAELHRLKGELLRATGHGTAEIAASLDTALAIARSQRAFALERRILETLNKAD